MNITCLMRLREDKKLFKQGVSQQHLLDVVFWSIVWKHSPAPSQYLLNALLGFSNWKLVAVGKKIEYVTNAHLKLEMLHLAHVTAS